MSLPAQRARREYAASVCVGIAAASWAFHIYLWLKFAQKQPRMPVGEFIYAMNNHGSKIYLSAVQATQLGILPFASIAAFAVAIVLVGKFLIKRPWEMYTVQPKIPGRGLLLGFSAVAWGGICWFSSAEVASFLVCRGLILKP